MNKMSMQTMPLYRYFIKKDALVFCYHVISERPLNHITGYNYKTPEAFENDIIFLKKNFNLISYGQLLGHFFGRTKIQKPAAILSFDDGLSQCFSLVRPILLKHNVSCIFFITADFMDNKHIFYENKLALCINAIKNLANLALKQILYNINSKFGQFFKNRKSLIRWIKTLDYNSEDTINAICAMLRIDTAEYLSNQRPYLATEEIKTLAADGFTIGAHGKKHIRLDLLSADDAEKEIVESCKIIMGLLSIEHLPFAFPYHGIYIDRIFLERLITKHKFIDVFFDSQGLRGNENFIINRVWADKPAGTDKSNIPRILFCAYRDYLKLKVSTAIKKLKPTF